MKNANSAEIHDLAHAVAAIVRRQGQHDFPSYRGDDQVQTAFLCGLTVFIKNEQIIRIKAPDFDILLGSAAHRPANDEKVVTLADYAPCKFILGGPAELSLWHSRLALFMRVFHNKQQFA